MKTIVFLLEEQSAKAMLQVIIPRLDDNPEHEYKYITFQGKTDLEKQVEKKIRNWITPDTYFIIIRDKDSADCKMVKANLQLKCRNAGKSDRSLVRIACHELETFYLGDLKAVSKAFNNNSIEHFLLKKKYKNPDIISNPKEELKKITKQEYQPISGSRKIAQYLKLDGTNTSVSFNVLIDGIAKILKR